MPPSCLHSTGASFYISESPKANITWLPWWPLYCMCITFELDYFWDHISTKVSLQEGQRSIRKDCLSDTKMTPLLYTWFFCQLISTSPSLLPFLCVY